MSSNTITIDCRPATWRNRAASVLANDLVELTHLTGGGQMPDFHFHNSAHINPFWIPRWDLWEPTQFRPARDEAKYGPREVGKLLSVVAGHSLCLEVFGMPSEEEVRSGAALHGKAGIMTWKAELASGDERGEMRFTVRLSRSGLLFTRTVSLERGESAVRIHETVRNLLGTDQFIQWQQHAVLGPEFVSRDATVITMPGRKCMTDPDNYDGRGLLASGADFEWPHAPGAKGGAIDLQVPLQTPGTGFIAGVQMDPRREHSFVCAVNRFHSMAFGYVFLRSDFPWVAIWEENRARAGAPWRGVEQTRAFEFGVSPLPIGRDETLRRGIRFDTPVIARLPAKSEISGAYLMFLARLPCGVDRVMNIAPGENDLSLLGNPGETVSVLPIRGARDFLARKETRACY